LGTLWNILEQLDQVVLSDLTIDLEVRAVVRTPPETEGSEGVTEQIVLQRLGQFQFVSIQLCFLADKQCDKGQTCHAESFCVQGMLVESRL
jgi:hypothetical protein